ncbi:MAG TPA: hypothetical protein VEF04_10600 [Blastocatellia bacterium]|nr:hypothetical protein [Blastocatellia bacterium]
MKWTGKKTASDESLDRVGSEVINAFRASESEINSVADSRELYCRLRARINAEREMRESQSSPLPVRGLRNDGAMIPVFSWFRNHTMIWGLAGALAMILVIALVFAPRPAFHKPIDQVVNPPATKTIHPPQSPRAVEAPPKNDAETETNDYAVHDKLAKSSKRAFKRDIQVVGQEANEIATEYLPLTLAADLDDSDGGQIIRISLPRSALASFGLPVDPELADEIVRADVMMGDDGLARAIRLIEPERQ